jgi:hypothetical protein
VGDEEGADGGGVGVGAVGVGALEGAVEVGEGGVFNRGAAAGGLSGLAFQEQGVGGVQGLGEVRG